MVINSPDFSEYSSFWMARVSWNSFRFALLGEFHDIFLQ